MTETEVLKKGIADLKEVRVKLRQVTEDFEDFYNGPPWDKNALKVELVISELNSVIDVLQYDAFPEAGGQ